MSVVLYYSINQQYDFIWSMKVVCGVHSSKARRHERARKRIFKRATKLVVVNLIKMFMH